MFCADACYSDRYITMTPAEFKYPGNVTATYEVVFEVRMHVVDAVVHDSRRDAVARVTERPCRLHVQIQLRYATSLTSVVLHTHTLFRKTAPKNEQHIQNLKFYNTDNTLVLLTLTSFIRMYFYPVNLTPL